MSSKQVTIDGDTWNVLSLGAERRSPTGWQVFVHLASTTRALRQRNGWYPIQRCQWVDIGDIVEVEGNE